CSPIRTVIRDAITMPNTRRLHGSWASTPRFRPRGARRAPATTSTRFRVSRPGTARTGASACGLSTTPCGATTPVPENNARLKVLYHHRTASRDGQAVHIEEMVSALRKLGCEVIVVEPPSTAGAHFGADARGLSSLRRLLPKAAGELLEVGYNWFAYRRLKRAYRVHRPDVLYERHNLYLLAGKWLRRRFKLPYLLEVNAPIALERSRHGGLALPGLARRLEASVWNAADAVLPVTAVLAEMLVEQGVERERIVVIPNGIDLGAFE